MVIATAPDAQQTTQLYKIYCINPAITAVYVGQTKNLIKRRQYHKSACNNEEDKAYHYYVYQFIRANGGWGDWRVEPIESITCSTKIEVADRERCLIQLLGATLNRQTPARTKAEYCADNKDKRKQYKHEYYTKNKESLKPQYAEYYTKNEATIKQYHHEWYTTNKDKLKTQYAAYYEKNKEVQSQRQKERYAANKDAINLKRREQAAAKRAANV